MSFSQELITGATYEGHENKAKFVILKQQIVILTFRTSVMIIVWTHRERTSESKTIFFWSFVIAFKGRCAFPEDCFTINIPIIKLKIFHILLRAFEIPRFGKKWVVLTLRSTHLKGKAHCSAKR